MFNCLKLTCGNNPFLANFGPVTDISTSWLQIGSTLYNMVHNASWGCITPSIPYKFLFSSTHFMLNNRFPVRIRFILLTPKLHDLEKKQMQIVSTEILVISTFTKFPCFSICDCVTKSSGKIQYAYCIVLQNDLRPPRGSSLMIWYSVMYP